MNTKHIYALAVIAMSLIGQTSYAECTPIPKPATDALETGFCESDSVFVAKVELIIETIRAYTEEGTDRTKHYRIQRATMKVGESFKGDPAAKVTMIADLYAKDGAYVFDSNQEVLVFAKKLPGENEYAGANACAIQPTLQIKDASEVLKKLKAYKSGKQKIDCGRLQQ